jgi:transcriptional regulatory protein GAL4
LFHASFVPLIALHTDLNSPERSKWGEAVDQALRVLRVLREEPLAQRCLQVVELLDPRNPYQGQGQGNDVNPWINLLQMDQNDYGGPAETL